ncbi:uncharacterized protein LOC118453232 [Egretta garzetta]|uniref:uncharacterized protein LOC118453232 n=1 Tax=Egretta garzetta TaxID=188379 RepID=UPI00163C951B|nr:uncharacterized protein LOC118453232 [Egretta garzetta]
MEYLFQDCSRNLHLTFLVLFFTFLLVVRILGHAAGHSWCFHGEQTCSVGPVSGICCRDLARRGGMAPVCGLGCVRMNQRLMRRRFSDAAGSCPAVLARSQPGLLAVSEATDPPERRLWEHPSWQLLFQQDHSVFLQGNCPGTTQTLRPEFLLILKAQVSKSIHIFGIPVNKGARLCACGHAAEGFFFLASLPTRPEAIPEASPARSCTHPGSLQCILWQDTLP